MNLKIASLLLPMSMIIACNNADDKNKENSGLCVSSVSYDERDKTFNPALIKITIVDPEAILAKEANTGSITEVFFANVPRSDRFAFKKTNYFEVRHDTVVLGVMTNTFKADTLKRWTTAEINAFLGKDIGVVVNKETLYIKGCN